MNDASNDSGQPLIAHLLELRNRLLKAMAAISVVFLGLFYFSRELYTLVAKPLMQAMPEGTSMIATGVASPFLAPFKLTLYLSIFVAMPFILHQAWAFVAPGLYRHEKRLAIPLLGSSVLLFYAGAAFAYFVVFPLMFQFFTAIAPEGVAVTTDISSYLDFVLALFLAFGLAFELPIAIVLLVGTGVTTVEKLASVAGLCGGGLLRGRHAADTTGHHQPDPAGAAHVVPVRGWPDGRALDRKSVV